MRPLSRLALVLALAAYAVPAASQATPSAADETRPAGVTEREVQIGSGEWAVGGTVSIPEGRGPFPAVVLIPGSGPASRDLDVGPNKVFREMAWALARRGVAVLRFDKRTWAHAARFRARGRPATLEEEFIADATSAARALLQLPGVDRRRVYVLGHSQGALIAPLVAERVPTVAGVVLAAGSDRPPADIIEEQANYVRTLPQADSSARARVPMMLDAVARIRDAATPDSAIVLGREMSYWRAVQASQPKTRVCALLGRGGRAMVVHGGRDYLVSDSDFAGWQERFGRDPAVTLRRYADLNHLLQPGTGRMTPQEFGERRRVSDPLMDDLAQWLRAPARPPATRGATAEARPCQTSAAPSPR